MDNHIVVSADNFRRYYTHSFNDVAEKYGLNYLQCAILLFFYNNESFNTAKDVVEKRGFAKSNVSKALEKLQEQGYLSYDISHSDRREHPIKLNPEKQQVFEELFVTQKNVLSKLTEGFTDEEKQLLKDFLVKIEENINNAV